MNKHFNKSSLSTARRRLLEMMQEINFGRIENLAIRSGEPLFDPTPRVIRKIKCGGENGPRRERKSDDFELKAEHVVLFECLDHWRDGTIRSLQVKYGLPFDLEVEDSAA